MKPLIALSLTLLLILNTAVPLHAAPPPPPQPEIEWEAGTPTLVRGPIPATGNSPQQAAYSFFENYKALYGMHAPTHELQVKSVTPDDLGLTHVKFTQLVDGVPVFGAELIVHLTDTEIRSVNGYYFPNLQIDPRPKITQAEALARVRRELQDPQAEFKADHSRLVVYVENSQPYLAWEINCFSQHPLGNWLYFIDAHTGKPLHHINKIDLIRIVRMYDAGNQEVIPGTLICGDGLDDDCSKVEDPLIKAGYNHSSHAYDYYSLALRRESYDNAGSPLHTIARYGTNFDNAFWYSGYLIFGDADRYIEAFDVVAHELTHGVTEYTADLYYQNQSGALNESWSDVMAVLAGCSPASEQADCDWLMGEDLNYGPLRSLSNPPERGQPDEWREYYNFPPSEDYGGVHTNSGIPNKAAYLTTMGGTFNKITVTGIGYTRTEQIYYRALANYMVSRSVFTDARNSLYSACLDLIGSSYDITQTHCLSIQHAWQAIGLPDPAFSMNRRLYLPIIVRN